jgi:hypothetical protein
MRATARRVRAIAWVTAGGLVAFTQGAITWAARGVDKLYAADPYWLVAAYAEPWRTSVAAGVIVLSLAVSLSAARARQPLSWQRIAATAAVLFSGLAICMELTRAVHFNDALGEIYVHTFVFRRAKVSVWGGNGACLHADFESPFVWRLNGTSIHPRLLPLPYESSAVVSRLTRASHGCATRR